MKFIVIWLLFINTISTSPTPIVLWHGMGDTCCSSLSLGPFKKFLENAIPGVYVNSLIIGNNTIEDFENGYFLNPNKQIDYACDIVKKDINLQDGFNAIGFSQGSQFLRALVQRCGQTIPTIKNLISVGGQHQGVYGIPNCGSLKHKSCDYIREVLNYAAYNKYVQESLVQATYWHDPLDEATYKAKSQFLADINNERIINQTYIDNLKNLEHFVMVLFTQDTIVQPKETEWFGFYVPGNSKEVQTLQQSEIYLQDRLGLKAMDETGKLVFLSVEGNHLHFNENWFTDNIIKPYLL